MNHTLKKPTQISLFFFYLFFKCPLLLNPYCTCCSSLSSLPAVSCLPWCHGPCRSHCKSPYTISPMSNFSPVVSDTFFLFTVWFLVLYRLLVLLNWAPLTTVSPPVTWSPSRPCIMTALGGGCFGHILPTPHPHLCIYIFGHFLHNVPLIWLCFLFLIL